MDFYLSIGGVKKGPFSIFKVGDLLESGEVDPDTLAWHRELGEWTPIREVPALEMVSDRNQQPPPPARTSPPSPPLPPLSQPDSQPSPPPKDFEGLPLPSPELSRLGPPSLPPQARPFIRFWARMFDYMVVSVVVFQFSDVAVPQVVPNESFADLFSRYLAEMQKPEALILARTLFLALIGWHALEAVLIHLVGTTAGKALFGLSVSAQEGGRVPLLRSLGRSFYVYVLGVGFYQFPFILIGMVFSLFRIRSSGQCLWDQHLKIRVENSSLGAVRIMLAIGGFFALLLLQSVKF